MLIVQTQFLCSYEAGVVDGHHAPDRPSRLQNGPNGGFLRVCGPSSLQRTILKRRQFSSGDLVQFSLWSSDYPDIKVTLLHICISCWHALLVMVTDDR